MNCPQDKSKLLVLNRLRLDFLSQISDHQSHVMLPGIRFPSTRGPIQIATSLPFFLSEMAPKGHYLSCWPRSSRPLPILVTGIQIFLPLPSIALLYLGHPSFYIKHLNLPSIILPSSIILLLWQNLPNSFFNDPPVLLSFVHIMLSRKPCTGLNPNVCLTGLLPLPKLCRRIPAVMASMGRLLFPHH